MNHKATRISIESRKKITVTFFEHETDDIATEAMTVLIVY